MEILCFRRQTLWATCVSLCVAAICVLAGWAFAGSASAATVKHTSCAVTAPGLAHCDTTLLTQARTHKLVHPHVKKVALRSAHAVAAQPQAHSPQWLQQAYDLTWLSANRGAGDTVAVVVPSGSSTVANDLATFRSTDGLPACTQDTNCFRIVNEQGQASPLPAADTTWSNEATLDVEAVSAICPNCSILLVEAAAATPSDLQQAMQTAVNLGANQISDSWSITASSSPFPAQLLTPASGAALPAVFAAAGDAGNASAGTANYPAALSTVTAVGGTTLSQTGRAAGARGFTETAWANTGAGCATDQPTPSYQSNTGCAGRAYSDVSADADPTTGLSVYESSVGGWVVAGGTSLATPMVAAYAALTGVAANGSPAWAYADAGALNDPSSGSDGTCTGLSATICTAGAGYDGPTGAGSISGAVVTGAPGITGPSFLRSSGLSDAGHITKSSATLRQGLYSNGQAATYSWQYGTTTAYGSSTATATVAAGTAAQVTRVSLTGLKANTTYHYRLVATNASGTVTGADMTFTTSAH